MHALLHMYSVLQGFCTLSSFTSSILNLGTQPLEGDSLETRASLIAAKIKLGDPCTYRLIGKNVTNLLTPKYAALKEETLDNLEMLIRWCLRSSSGIDPPPWT